MFLGRPPPPPPARLPSTPRLLTTGQREEVFSPPEEGPSSTEFSLMPLSQPFFRLCLEIAFRLQACRQEGNEGVFSQLSKLGNATAASAFTE